MLVFRKLFFQDVVPIHHRILEFRCYIVLSQSVLQYSLRYSFANHQPGVFTCQEIILTGTATAVETTVETEAEAVARVTLQTMASQVKKITSKKPNRVVHPPGLWK
jgi:hypothetical protein